MKGEFKATDWLTIDQHREYPEFGQEPSQADINTVIRTEPSRCPRIDGYEQFEDSSGIMGLMILPQLANGGEDIFTSTVWMKTVPGSSRQSCR
jgi:hypothetical protein